MQHFSAFLIAEVSSSFSNERNKVRKSL